MKLRKGGNRDRGQTAQTQSELAVMIVDALKGQGFLTVQDVVLHKVTDASSPFSWSVTTIKFGQEDGIAVRSAMQGIQRALQELYDLAE